MTYCVKQVIAYKPLGGTHMSRMKEYLIAEQEAQDQHWDIKATKPVLPINKPVPPTKRYFRLPDTSYGSGVYLPVGTSTAQHPRRITARHKPK